MPQGAHAATEPAVPQNVVAPANGDSITLMWQAPLDDGSSVITGYYARIRIHGDSMWSSITMQASDTSITFGSLTPASHYDVAIATFNAIGASADVELSDILVGNVPNEVENLVFVDSAPSLGATWNPPAYTGSTEISSYDFEYSVAGQDAWGSYNVGTNAAQVNGLPDGLYDIRVRANNSVGSGDWTYLRNQYLGVINYDITTCQDLQAMRYELDAAYNLANNIDCTGVEFVPVGTNDHPFIGSLEGNDYTISGLSIEAPIDYVGLFGAIDASHIQNFTINGTVNGGSYAGGLVGKALNMAAIHNVQSNVMVDGGNYSGGLIGYTAGLDGNNLQVTNSSASGAITGDEAVGGLIGYATATTVLNSHATGLVTSSLDYAGGLLGRSIGNTISQSYATGTVISEATRGGGLVGESISDTISDSYARGDASTPNIYYAGGLVGAMDNSSLTRVYSTGVVHGYGIIGGLVGYNASGSSITDSFSASYVLPHGDSWDMRANNGLVGIDYSNEITYSNVFYNSINNAINCARDDSFNIVTSSDCTGINLQFNETTFIEADDSPINTWDLGGIWHLNADDFPTLSPIRQPYILCEKPQRTDSTVSVHCVSAPAGWGATTWEMQYKKTAESNWVDVSLADSSDARATITGLTSGTAYQVRFRFTNDWGTSQWGRQDITTTGIAPASAEKTTEPTAANETITYLEQLTSSIVESSKDEPIDLDGDTQFTSDNGKQLSLRVGQVVYFVVNGERHSATVKEITDSYVVLTIASTPRDVRINTGSSFDIDVNDDGINDVSIGLISTSNKIATLNFKQITDKVAAPIGSNDTTIGQINNTLFYTFLIGGICFVLFILLISRLREQEDSSAR